MPGILRIKKIIIWRSSIISRSWQCKERLEASWLATRCSILRRDQVKDR